MFIDEKELAIKAGKGGNGAILFRREIYVPRGGPDGGDGGRGGDVIIAADPNLNTLSHLAHIEKIVARGGDGGGHQRSSGKSADAVTVHVPLGTVIEEKKEDSWISVYEINEPAEQIVIAKGGNGGWGNWHFRSSIQQAPERANAGLPGDAKQIRLVLKLIADIGLIGLPNAGKSTLLSVISAARPKIANYPFTTLEPQLGVVSVGSGIDAGSLVVADLPGLIEGASTGKGLGITFLKHIERTKLLMHCLAVDVSEGELLKNYKAIRNELIKWSADLAAKPEIIVLTKLDIVDEEEANIKKTFLMSQTGQKVYLISAAAHQGLNELLTDCYKLV